MIQHTIATTRTGAPILQPMSIDLQNDWHFYTYIMGGPLDAPDVMPAGCMQSTEWTDAHGRSLPSVAGVERG